jgi:23S rRNA G2445 N2-methylase RlmL
MYIKGFPHEIWDELRQKARSKARKTLQAKIIATDIDETAVQAARHNAQTAGVDHLIEFETCPFEKTSVPQGGGVIMINPPYGQRLDAVASKQQYPESKKETMQGRSVIVRKAADREVKDSGLMINTLRGLETMYEGIGDFFKQTGGGYRGYIFTGNLDMAKKVGLRTKRRLTFYNGEIECRLLEYELYAGSLKHPEPDKASV